jgi:hypothetical protein
VREEVEEVFLLSGSEDSFLFLPVFKYFFGFKDVGAAEAYSFYLEVQLQLEVLSNNLN